MSRKLLAGKMKGERRSKRRGDGNQRIHEADLRTQKLQQAIVDRSVGRTDGAQQAEASATNDERVDTWPHDPTADALALSASLAAHS